MELPIFKIFKIKTRDSGMFEEGEEMGVTDFIAPTSLKVESGLLRLGERLARSFFIFSYPRYLTTGWFFPIINLDYPANISFFFHPMETGKVLKQLQKKITEVQAEFMEREQKGLVRDPALEIAYKDIEELRDGLQTSQERMFRFGLYLTIYGDTEKEIRDIETALRSILESKLIYIKPALYQQKEGFNSCVPYGLDQLLVHNLLNTSPLSSTFPFISFDLSSNEGILYGINQHNNSLVLFDRFGLENANSVVFAKSGSGKSLIGSEPVLIRNKDKIQLTKISPLVEKLIKKYGATEIDEEMEGVISPPNLQVYSFDKNLKGKWSRVTVAARKKAPDVFYKFVTQSGREITTTGDHNMLILRNGKVIAAKSSEIKEGEFIPLPRKIPLPKRSSWCPLNAPRVVNLLGGRGRSKQKRVWPFVFNLRKEKIAQYLSAYFEGDGGVEKNQVAATSKSKQLISEITYLLYYFGIIGRIRKTRKKPTNGNWKRKKIYYELSISGQDNLRKFAENINFISQRKKKLLSEMIQKQGNTNLDIIPGIDSIFNEIHQLFGCQLGGIQDISELKRKAYHPSPEKLNELIKKIEERIQNFKNLASTFKVLSELPELATLIDLGRNDKKFNRTLGQALGQSYNRSLQPAIATCVRQNTDYKMLQKAAQFVWQNYQDILVNKIPQVEERLEQLKFLANSDLFWDPIVKIKKSENKKEKYVYDLTVDNEVFLAGQGGMFVHNSYAIKLEILRSLMTGVDVIVLDPENEYKSLVEAVGGSFINVSLASPNHINPFDLPVAREDEKPEDVLRINVINLIGLIRIMLGGLSPEEDSVMDQAITETYAAKDITPDSDPATWNQKTPLIEDLESVLEGMEGTDSLIKRMRKFTKGTYSQFFNQQTNISTEKPLVVFGIRDMEDELRPMAMFIIMRYIWNKARSSLKKRILVIDEAWWLMQSQDGASFLYGTCKRARKYWLGVTTITQDVNDFMTSPYGQAIISNSSLQFLMKQSTATIDIIQKSFNLTEEEKSMLLGVGVGEGLFFAGQKHVMIRVVASYTEDQIVTTAPEELLKIKKAKEEFMSRAE